MSEGGKFKDGKTIGDLIREKMKDGFDSSALFGSFTAEPEKESTLTPDTIKEALERLKNASPPPSLSDHLKDSFRYMESPRRSGKSYFEDANRVLDVKRDSMLTAAMATARDPGEDLCGRYFRVVNTITAPCVDEATYAPELRPLECEILENAVLKLVHVDRDPAKRLYFGIFQIISNANEPGLEGYVCKIEQSQFKEAFDAEANELWKVAYADVPPPPVKVNKKHLLTVVVESEIKVKGVYENDKGSTDAQMSLSEGDVCHVMKADIDGNDIEMRVADFHFELGISAFEFIFGNNALQLLYHAKAMAERAPDQGKVKTKDDGRRGMFA